MKNEPGNNGVFVISLDLELLWGIWDVASKDGAYGENIKAVKKVIPALLSLFEQYSIKATFATVGFLFAKNKTELSASLPSQKPKYSNPGYNVYLKEINSVGIDETDDPFHFGFSLLQLLKNSCHEIGTHTHSHYYCLENGQTAEDFEADLLAAKKIATANNIKLESFVFPRNQVNENYLQILYNNGIKAYRGNPTSWIYKPRRFAAEILFIRLCRLIDAYLPVSGMNGHSLTSQKNKPVNIAASRFMKPWFMPLSWLEPLRLYRIKQEMTNAAKNKKLYHLWWHPHNFGKNLDKNIKNLSILLNHYQQLNKKYGFTCCSMQEAALLIATKK
ncbi:MAG TPA: polysaccharide deacetylase family protein [Ferruginibacter sp.]|nr:polysaccharide deacetylase family protein [Ferruginibacter sp.]